MQAGKAALTRSNLPQSLRISWSSHIMRFCVERGADISRHSPSPHEAIGRKEIIHDDTNFRKPIKARNSFEHMVSYWMVT